MQRICGLRPRIERTAVPLDTVFVKVFYSPARFIPIIRLLQALAIEPSFRSFFTPRNYVRSMQPICKKNNFESELSAIFLAYVHFLLYLCTFFRACTIARARGT